MLQSLGYSMMHWSIWWDPSSVIIHGFSKGLSLWAIVLPNFYHFYEALRCIVFTVQFYMISAALWRVMMCGFLIDSFTTFLSLVAAFRSDKCLISIPPRLCIEYKLPWRSLVSLCNYCLVICSFSKSFIPFLYHPLNHFLSSHCCSMVSLLHGKVGKATCNDIIVVYWPSNHRDSTHVSVQMYIKQYGDQLDGRRFAAMCVVGKYVCRLFGKAGILKTRRRNYEVLWGKFFQGVANIFCLSSNSGMWYPTRGIWVGWHNVELFAGTLLGRHGLYTELLRHSIMVWSAAGHWPFLGHLFWCTIWILTLIVVWVWGAVECCSLFNCGYGPGAVLCTAEGGAAAALCFDPRRGQGSNKILVRLQSGVRNRVDQYGFWPLFVGCIFDAALAYFNIVAW